MRSKPDSCGGCPLEPHGNDFSAVEGTGSSGVMVVAEASGEQEARDNLPLRPYAPSGSLYERTLRRMGMSREQFATTNVCRCRPRNNWLEKSPWEYAALAHCRPNLEAAIASRRPRAIVALGGVATRELTGMVGEARGVGHLAGYVLPGPGGTNGFDDSEVRGRDANRVPDSMGPDNYVRADRMAVVPVISTFHPAYIRRGKASLQGVFARNIQRAVNVASGRDKSYLFNVVPSDSTTHGGLRYATHPSLDEAEAFARYVEGNAAAVVSYDLETSESASLDEDAREGFEDTHIRLVQFSVGAGTGIAFPWEGGYRDVAARVLRTPNVKVGHNVWTFDNKVLKACGAREGLDLAPRGTIHDTLAMFHHWQPDLPAHLQFAASFVQFPFPWKHLAGTDVEFYGCADVDATWRLFAMLEATMKRDGLWD